MILIILIGISTQILFHEWLKIHYHIKMALGVNPLKTYKPLDCENCMAFWFTLGALISVELGVNIWYLTPLLVPLSLKLLNKYTENDNN